MSLWYCRIIPWNKYLISHYKITGDNPIVIEILKHERIFDSVRRWATGLYYFE